MKPHNRSFTLADVEAEHAESLEALVKLPPIGRYQDKVLTSGIGAQIKAAQLPPRKKENNMSGITQQEIDALPEEDRLFPKKEAAMNMIFCFGKHKGKQFEDVLSDNEGYIRWLCENEVIDFDEDCLEAMSKVGIA